MPAYDNLDRSARKDAHTRFNQATCCFMIGWYEEDGQTAWEIVSALLKEETSPWRQIPWNA